MSCVFLLKYLVTYLLTWVVFKPEVCGTNPTSNDLDTISEESCSMSQEGSKFGLPGSSLPHRRGPME